MRYKTCTTILDSEMKEGSQKSSTKLSLSAHSRPARVGSKGVFNAVVVLDRSCSPLALPSLPPTTTCFPPRNPSNFSTASGAARRSSSAVDPDRQHDCGQHRAKQRADAARGDPTRG